ncbi:MAG TPA: tetratricopeptide repeat protein [Candidatus Melainabacteria bacterium]|jgi:tetratricopeptide (TPR) repeat protein|nr:tetratricopeptide repeat protein [Candidatus Melainabacteria bacterium]
MIMRNYLNLVLSATLSLVFVSPCNAQTVQRAPGMRPLTVDGVWQHNPQTTNRDALRYHRQGVNLYDHAKMKDAIAQFNEAIKLEPKVAEFYYRRGDCWIELDKLKEAYADYTKAIELEPNHYPAYKRRARIDYERGKLEDAVKDYDSAAKRSPNKIERAEIIKLKAKIHSFMNKHDLAIEDLTQAVALNKTAHALMLRGNSYFSLKQYKKAIDDYTEAIKYKSPKLQERLFSMRADAYEKIGRFDLAKKDRKDAKSIVDDSWGGVLQDMDKQTKL